MEETVEAILQANMPWRTLVLTEKDYTEFKRQYIVDILKGKTLGRSFCEHFGIHDNLLTGDPNNTRVDKLIRHSYLKRQQVVQELYRKDK